MSGTRVNTRWEQKWHSNEARWHKSNVNSGLEENFLSALPYGESPTGKAVFVPFCGKALAMKWLCDQGMKVVGVEAIEMPIIQFFDEQNLSYERKAVKDYEVFIAKECNLQIFKGNLFQFCADDFDEKFDFIWDRGSLVAVEVEDQQHYVDLIATLMKKNATGLLESHEYEKSLRTEQPFAIFPDELKKLGKDLFQFEEVSREFTEAAVSSLGVDRSIVVYKLQRY